MVVFITNEIFCLIMIAALPFIRVQKIIVFLLLGKQLDGVWHTGVVVYGKEWFFGGMGVENCPPVREYDKTF